MTLRELINSVDSEQYSESALYQRLRETKPETQHFVDNGADVTGKKLSHMKYSSKRSDFLRFYAYLCHVIDDFACFDFAALR